MAKASKVTIVKKSAALKAAGPGAPGAKAIGTEFVFVDNEDSTCTVSGVNSSGNPVDISNVAKIAVTSSDPAVCGADAPTGMTFKMSGLKPGSAVLSVVATWDDDSIGPFSFDLPVVVTGSPATGITVTPGTPVVR